jgi:hypothetical protein
MAGHACGVCCAGREGSQGFGDDEVGAAKLIVQTPLGKFTMEDIGAMPAEKFEQLLQASTQAQAKDFLSMRRRARNNAASKKVSLTCGLCCGVCCVRALSVTKSGVASC